MGEPGQRRGNAAATAAHPKRSTIQPMLHPQPKEIIHGICAKCGGDITALQGFVRDQQLHLQALATPTDAPGAPDGLYISYHSDDCGGRHGNTWQARRCQPEDLDHAWHTNYGDRIVEYPWLLNTQRDIPRAHLQAS